MLTEKQRQLLVFIHERMQETGVAPSYEEMKDALSLKSKSGIHRLVNALVERGFIERMPHRARALEVVRLPDSFRASPMPRSGNGHSDDTPGSHGTAGKDRAGARGFKPSIIEGSLGRSVREDRPVEPALEKVPVLGRIAAGTPIEAIQHASRTIEFPRGSLGSGEYYALEVMGDSMIEAGIFDGDLAILERCETATTGDIVVALVDQQEATLKRFRAKGETIALEPANADYETRIFGPDRVRVQGRLVALWRQY